MLNVITVCFQSFTLIAVLFYVQFSFLFYSLGVIAVNLYSLEMIYVSPYSSNTIAVSLYCLSAIVFIPYSLNGKALLW